MVYGIASFQTYKQWLNWCMMLEHDLCEMKLTSVKELQWEKFLHVILILLNVRFKSTCVKAEHLSEKQVINCIILY